MEKAWLVECDAPETVAAIAADTATHKYCLRAGETGLVVKARQERAFRAALKKSGYVLLL